MVAGLFLFGASIWWSDRQASRRAGAESDRKRLEELTRADNALLDAAAEPIETGPRRVARKRIRMRKRRARSSGS